MTCCEVTSHQNEVFTKNVVAVKKVDVTHKERICGLGDDQWRGLGAAGPQATQCLRH